MTGWDILDKFTNGGPPIAATVLLAVVAVIFVVGFSRYGFNFLKYGFSQKEVADLSKKMDGLSGEIGNLRTELHTEISNLRTDLRNEFHTEIGNLRTDLRNEFHTEIGNLRTGFHTELQTIKVNHFGHLKNFLCELTSILLDKNVINNTDKARLDNQLRDM